MFVPLKIITDRAQRGRYAIPAFNFNNMETLQAVIEAAVEMRSPIIVATSEGAIKYAGMDYLLALTKVAAQAPISVVLHLDHGKDLNVIRQSIDAGYNSIMFDGSSLPFEENIKVTWRIAQWAHTKSISVEAELGSLRGIEDNVSVKDSEATLTDPEQAREFVNRTECDTLAVAIGTSHGAYKFKGIPRLDLRRLKEINQCVQIPLVLHGASGLSANLLKVAKKSGLKIAGAKGISDNLIKKAINLGICKINIDTDLRVAFAAAVRQTLKDDASIFDPRKILGPAKDLIFKVACEKIKLFGSAGRN